MITVVYWHLKKQMWQDQVRLNAKGLSLWSFGQRPNIDPVRSILSTNNRVTFCTTFLHLELFSIILLQILSIVKRIIIIQLLRQIFGHGSSPCITVKDLCYYWMLWINGFNLCHSCHKYMKIAIIWLWFVPNLMDHMVALIYTIGRV